MIEVLFFLLPLIIVILITPVLISLSQKKKIYDFPEGDELKIHKTPISILGGLSIFFGFFVLFLLLSIVDYKYLMIALYFFIIFCLGLWDDLKWKHITARKPFVKFFFLILCSFLSALVLYFTGFRFPFFLIIAPIYVFVFINAINYQDGMDGQAGFLSIISLFGFFVLSIMAGNSLAFIISISFIGAVFGFLFYNFPPAKIFMGDSGAYLLGGVLALLSFIFFNNIVSHLFVVGLPLFDGVYSNMRRLIRGKSIFLGDREHFYDRMIKRGFSVKKTLLISGLAQMGFVITGIFVYIINI